MTRLPAGVVHALAIFLLATNVIPMSILPLIAVREFGARPQDLVLLTAAVPTLLSLSIFWNALLRRLTPRHYLALYWLIAGLPLACMSLATEYWHLLLCHVIAAAGAAGWTPINGVLLKEFYADRARGRVYGVLNAVTLVGNIGALLGTGWWLAREPESFRIFLPAAALLQALGLATLARRVPDGRSALRRPAAAPGSLAAERAGPERSADGSMRGSAAAPPAAAPAWRWSAWLAPLRDLRRTLREDRRFLRYEQAFMTYGCGYMICEALLPLLITRHLNLNYDQAAQHGYAVTRACMLLTVLPLGWLNDRVGPMRLSAMSFLVLSAYPLLLLTAGGVHGLSAASAVFGLGMAGMMFGWMLGPVALAADRERVAEYVAIHTTLVGLRGIVFQFAGTAIFLLTGSFAIPLAIASGAFLWAAWQMHRLAGDGRPVGGR